MESVDVWVNHRRSSEVVEEVNKLIELGKFVQVCFGEEYPSYDILKGIYPYWKSRKLDINVWHNSDYKSAIRTLNSLKKRVK